MRLNVDFRAVNDRFCLEMAPQGSSRFDMCLDAAYKPNVTHDTPPWEGSYVFTPTQSRQVVPVVGLRMTQNMVINPIPSNYGKIGWDGFTMTVS